MREIKIGVIGCGGIAQWAHLPVLTGPDVLMPEEPIPGKSTAEMMAEAEIVPRVVALCDIREELLRSVGDRYRIDRRFTDYRELLEQVDIEAVLVLAGHKVNYEVIPLAVEKGKHIFVEKPMTGTLEEALEVERIVKGSGIVFQVGFMRRFYFAYREAKRMIEGGEIGEIQALGGRFWSGRLDDLLNNGVHIFDIVQFFGRRAAEVYAKAKGNHIALTIGFEGGVVGNLFLSDTSWNHSVHERLEIAGSDGRTLVAENGRRLWMYAPRGSESIFDLSGEPARFWEPPQVVHAITGYNLAGFAGEHKHFLRCIASGTNSSVGVEAGVDSIRLKEGVERSLETGKVVRLLT